MSHSENTQKMMIRDYEERLRSLVYDGYQFRHETRNDRFFFARLKHMSNGNSISMVLNFEAKTLVQKTNMVITHQQSYV